MNKLILGSGSPRRKELLSYIWNGEIEIIKSDIKEVYPANLPLDKVPIFLAKLKADDLKNRIDLTENILITADTIVICDNKVLGKPIDIEDAKKMLHFLSGKIHQVITGVAIYTKNHSKEIEEKTDVYFKELSLSDIEFYTKNFNPLDKAGAYGIQEFIGMIGIEKINGCYYNVMGLPTTKVYKELINL